MSQLNNNNNINNNEQEEIHGKKILHKKRKPEYSLEDILNIYCCTHKINDNEIQEKILKINYEKPSENLEINYDKEKGDVFPLSHHIMPMHSKKELKVIDDEEEEKDEKEEKVQMNKEQVAEPKKDEISNCFLCGWEFLEGMSLQEKNTHMNLCAEGKGEENKKELISTYNAIENLQNQNDERENNEHPNVQNNEQNENEDKSDEDKNEEEDKEDDEEDKESHKENKYFDGNDDDLIY